MPACSAVPDSVWPWGLYPSRLLQPCGSPGKNTGVGCHFLLQGIFSTQGSNPGLLRLVTIWTFKADYLTQKHVYGTSLNRTHSLWPLHSTISELIQRLVSFTSGCCHLVLLNNKVLEKLTREWMWRPRYIYIIDRFTNQEWANWLRKYEL